VIDRDSGRFVAGRSYSPETQFRKGEHRSIATEFVPGAPARNKLPVGSVRIRLNKKLNQRRAWIKVSEPNVWRLRAVMVWEKLNGSVPEGYVVHHEDRDTLNDSPKNLAVITKLQHLIEHRSEMSNTAHLEYRGETKTLAEWCRLLSLRAGTIQWRIAAKWSVERAFNTPIRNKSKTARSPQSA
jgi:hypothetical protein